MKAGVGDGREWLGQSRMALSPGSTGLSRPGAWPSSGLEEQLLWLHLDSDGESLRTSLAAAGLDRRTHLSFSLIFFRTEGKRKHKCTSLWYAQSCWDTGTEHLAKLWGRADPPLCMAAHAQAVGNSAEAMQSMSSCSDRALVVRICQFLRRNHARELYA